MYRMFVARQVRKSGRRVDERDYRFVLDGSALVSSAGSPATTPWAACARRARPWKRGSSGSSALPGHSLRGAGARLALADPGRGAREGTGDRGGNGLPGTSSPRRSTSASAGSFALTPLRTRRSSRGRCGGSPSSAWRRPRRRRSRTPSRRPSELSLYRKGDHRAHDRPHHARGRARRPGKGRPRRAPDCHAHRAGGRAGQRVCPGEHVGVRRRASRRRHRGRRATRGAAGLPGAADGPRGRAGRPRAGRRSEP